MSNLRQLFLQHVAQTSETPLMLEITSAEGMYLYDPEGKAYLDLIAGIGVSSLGHRHPAVVQAAKDQLDKYLHTIVYGEFVLAPQIQLAQLMAEHLPEPLDSVYFVNSGTEATEGAMKLAKRYTGRPKIVAARYAYHGSSQGAASLMWPTDFTQAYHPLLPGIEHIEFNEEEDLDKIDRHTAAVIVETVQAEWGIRRPTDTYLLRLKERCEDVGALLILDEIQAGYGRTGTLWAFQQYGIVPDILLLAKGMGGGMPIGAFVASRELMQVLSHNPILGHITTFGGHPVSCAAALATLQTLLSTDLIDQVKAKEQLFRELLDHPKIVDKRSAGLWMAVELPDFDFVQGVIRHCLANGLVTDWFLFNSHSLRIAPPLIINENQVKEACRIIIDGIERQK
ncbi:aspartate aminotransferase family protein [Flavilitoribacter nigricans]|uniref:Aspartate aminotransferase family protein n=1 Tax=Flavilitoribacter nigricans (strain ATCC 23147 / DSM 23189 / NBRC 102662 / NCIMB 1420 / SS-2) TaxID=1122177 RepID=A0A2D0MY72_FLAN2|nr:aspartate aminotransferase family protein [Flavilitoribacter nigricans]PHN01076.1 aspartate aminotransferase family protein [Flavilitoribacter nigricans DSM 23189 = NBRC 102662]